ncbi:MAG: Holliday junction branch migration protein RuvA [Anaerolineae bacterium]
MIASLEGTLLAQDDSSVVVGVGGVGLRVRVPTTVLDRSGPIGSPIRLSTHLHVRENELALYGFVSEAERELFEQLLTVKGVGPRMALAVLSRINPDTLRAAIASGQVDVLTQVPGVGRRTAQQMVVDLKGKLDLSAVGGGVSPTAGFSFADAEVIEALTGLGYSVAEAQAALRALPTDEPLTTEEKVFLALQSFGAPR